MASLYLMNKLIVRASLLSSITSGEGSSALSSEITDTQDGHVVRGGVAVDMDGHIVKHMPEHTGRFP